MAASYPSSAKSFTTKTTSQTIDASHINDLQEEVTAVETDLVAGLPATRGGTGQTSYAVGDLLYASTTTALSKLAGVAIGRVLVSGGVGAAPVWSIVPTAWTPNDQSGAALVFTTVEAFYVRIGPLVVATATLTFPATADGSNANIGGLPVTCQNTTNSIHGAIVNYTTETTCASMNIQTNTTRVLPYTTGGAQITNATFSGDTLRFTAVYLAA